MRYLRFDFSRGASSLYHYCSPLFLVTLSVLDSRHDLAVGFNDIMKVISVLDVDQHVEHY